MSVLPYFVSGRDDYHDRGIREIDSDTPENAAREFLKGYVEDWRGGMFDELRLSLEVWRGGETQQNATRYSGIVSTARNQHGDLNLTYEVQQESHA